MGSLVLFCCIVTLILLISAEGKSNIGQACHPSDLQGLTSFKAGIHSDDSGRVSKWLGQACCNWEGISCSNATGRVTQINLPNSYTSDNAPMWTTMHGLLSPSITLLCSLEVLDLGGLSGLTGEIPASIGFHLPKLQKLFLYRNKFSGPLPESICKLSNLQEMYLHENGFTGFLPKCLGNLKSLKTLDLHSNKFSGSIPGSLSNMTNLERLYLQNNLLTQHIPDGIGNMQALQELDLSSNSLTGRIPSSITNLRSINVLYLNNNQLQGKMPRILRSNQMPSLGFLRLNDNHLRGSIPNSFGYLTSLQRVSLANNMLEGSIPATIRNLRSLTELYLYGNLLSGLIPGSIGQLSQLLTFSISNNMIQGPLPHEMSLLSNLQTLDLSFNRLNLSSIPKWLLELPSLSKIHLAGCGIQGDLMESLQIVRSSMQELDLSANHLTGTIPALIGRVTGLYSLNLSVNSLVGEIPSTIRNLTGVAVLDLHSNQLTGSLESIFQVQSTFDDGSLTYIDLSDNKFSSGIEQIGSGVQKEIQYLNVSQNYLRGTIPTSIGNLVSLQTLDVSHNRVYSELPSFANATSLERLKLQKNQFTGKIPGTFLKLGKLKELDLSDNQLAGEIPYGKPLIDFPRSSYLGNTGLCGKPLDPCQA